MPAREDEVGLRFLKFWCHVAAMRILRADQNMKPRRFKKEFKEACKHVVNASVDRFLIAPVDVDSVFTKRFR